MVVAEYRWLPLWLSYFRVEETLKGPVVPGTRIWAFRQPVFETDPESGKRYLLLLDEAGNLYEGRTACGTYNALELRNDEIVDVTNSIYTVQLTGTSQKLDAFIDAIGRTNVLEVVRSGVSSIARGEKVLAV